MNIIRDVHFGNYSKIEFISQCGPKPAPRPRLPARADLPPAPPHAAMHDVVTIKPSTL